MFREMRTVWLDQFPWNASSWDTYFQLDDYLRISIPNRYILDEGTLDV